MYIVHKEQSTRLDVNVEFLQYVLKVHINQLALYRAINFNMSISTEVIEVWTHTTFQYMVVHITVILA